MNTLELDEVKVTQAVQSIKMLAVDGVEKAKSGHPGLPMGFADIAFVLWTNFLRFNPDNPKWHNRDRFILSPGHGSMLLYSLLHHFGFKLPIEEIKKFRQWKSLTPGHPEYGQTAGVETSTGPLGQGFTNGVGMALAERILGERVNCGAEKVIDHFTYIVVSDGDLMEGISSEAGSLAGHWGLGKIICIYDSNKITIEGKTDLAFTEDIAGRFKAYNWHVMHINGHNHQEIIEAVKAGQKESERPTIIIAETIIGKGSPKKENTSSAHGEPLGEDEIKQIKKGINWPDEPFYVPEETKQLCAERVKELKSGYDAWNDCFQKNIESDPKMFSLWNSLFNKEIPLDIDRELLKIINSDKPIATRSSSGEMMSVIADSVPSFIGGSADLAPSTKTYMKNFSDIKKDQFSGRNIHFGIREHAMGGIMNGMAIYGGIIPFGSTFLVFSDYMRPSIRLAALMKLQVIFIFTHDSIFVGEDGPTHQPIEQIPSLRLIPNLRVIRPADATETAAAWGVALNHKKGPTALILTRQNLPVLNRMRYASQTNLKKGAYILSECDNLPDLILMASGSEIQPVLEAAKILNDRGVFTRVLSFPCFELFVRQTDEYKESLLPDICVKRVAVEAASSMSWHRFVGDKGMVLGIDHFGESAPASVLSDEFGFTAEKIVQKIDKKWELA